MMRPSAAKHKVRSGVIEPVYERLALRVMGIAKLQPERAADPATPG